MAPPSSPPLAESALHMADPAEVSHTLDVFLDATLSLCQEVYRSEAVTHDFFKAAQAEIEAGGLSDTTAARLTDRARRTYSAHMACASIVAKRRTLAEMGDRETLIAVETAVFNTIFAAHFMAHMGEDRLGVIEGLAELKSDRASRSTGGKKGNLTRTKWYAEARERYDHFRSANPQVSQATRIANGILRLGPIPGSPSDERILAVVRKWIKEPNA
ncbi:hypothetical protein D3C72_647900 [compost metagenome]